LSKTEATARPALPNPINPTRVRCFLGKYAVVLIPTTYSLKQLMSGAARFTTL
jgi:hypothetical protein